MNTFVLVLFLLHGSDSMNNTRCLYNCLLSYIFILEVTVELKRGTKMGRVSDRQVRGWEPTRDPWSYKSAKMFQTKC